MNYSTAAATYRTANETVQKTRQVVLLYDAVIRFLQQAVLAIEDQRYEDRMNLLQKASNIVVGLQSALDFENGGEISQMLSNFYNAMDLRMMSVNRTNNAEDLEKIVREVKIMREAWEEIDKKSKMEAAQDLPQPEEPTSPPPVVDTENLSGSDFSA